MYRKLKICCTVGSGESGGVGCFQGSVERKGVNEMKGGVYLSTSILSIYVTITGQSKYTSTCTHLIDNFETMP